MAAALQVSPPTQIDARLLQRYDVATPRYTSYPTALAFGDVDRMPGPHVEDRGEPLSLYFHMVFCRSLCWYCACTKVVTRKQSKTGLYLDRLLSDLEARHAWVEHRPIVQLHLGGGTPTFFTPQELRALIRFVRERFDVADDAELSIEVDPRELSDAHVEALAEAGFSRASLGVQDHNPEVQEAIHRPQPYELTASAVERLRAAGINRINFDLVYGLPAQTPESFRRTVEDVAALEPDRLAVYSYAHVPWAAPAQKLVTRKHALPTASEKIEMFLAATKTLQQRGWVHVGMDHFAQPDDELSRALRDGTLRRNFMGYTTLRGVEIQAFGASGISQTRDGYYQADRNLPTWEAAIDEGRSPIVRGYGLDDEDRLRRDVIMGVMCSNEVDFATVGAPYGIDARELLADDFEGLTDLEADGLIEFDGRRLTVTPVGRFLVRNIAATFDADRNREGYSKAI